MSAPAHKRLKRGARSLFLGALVRALGLLPLRVALLLGSAVGWAGWIVARRTRALILKHLAIALPDKTEQEREAIGRACMVHLAWLAAEVITIRRYAARLPEYVSFAGDAERVLREVMARGRGMIFATGHLGNWELMARRVSEAGIPNAVIAKAGSDRRLNELMADLRASGGIVTLWREDPGTGRAMIRNFKDGKALGILIDQDTRVQGVFVPFFGMLAFTPRVVGDLAMRFKAPVVVAWCRRRGPRPGDGHEVMVEEVPFEASAPDREAEAVRITAACTSHLEAAIRARPEEWVWMHERWKRRPESEVQASSMPKSRELSAG